MRSLIPIDLRHFRPVPGGANVFRGRHAGRECRVTVWPMDGTFTFEQAIESFERHVELRGKLSHPGIPPVLGLANASGDPALIEAWVEGLDALEWRRKDPSRHAIGTVMLGACRILQHIESKGLQHRDVKPGNAVVNTSLRVSLIDLEGLARCNEAPSKRVFSSDHAGPEVPREVTHPNDDATTEFTAEEVPERHDNHAFAITCCDLILNAAIPTKPGIPANFPLRDRIEWPALMDDLERAGVHEGLRIAIAQALNPEANQRTSLRQFEIEIERFVANHRPRRITHALAVLGLGVAFAAAAGHLDLSYRDQERPPEVPGVPQELVVDLGESFDELPDAAAKPEEAAKPAASTDAHRRTGPKVRTGKVSSVAELRAACPNGLPTTPKFAEDALVAIFADSNTLRLQYRYGGTDVAPQTGPFLVPASFVCPG
ncbi:hypothetical protein LBMAG42_56270 [Deltaproteobacteria bacterium]|nr:hypothetical protein LBMAG42_56270 [Deltaproteobacteria bacterium]